VVRGGCLEHHLTADGEADGADPGPAHVRTPTEPRHRRVDVGLSAPAEHVRVAVAPVVAAGVDEEHAVAVADEHPRLGHGALARRVGDHRRAVAGRDVPGGQIDTILRPDRDPLVGATEIDRHDRLARSMRGDDRDRDRRHDEVRADHDPERKGGAAEIAVPPSLARAPEQCDGQSAEAEPERKEQEPGPVLPARSDAAGVRDRERGPFQRQHAQHAGDDGPGSRSQPGVGECRRREDRERGHHPGQVIPDPGARLGRDGRVDHDVEGDERDRAPDEQHLGTSVDDRVPMRAITGRCGAHGHVCLHGAHPHLLAPSG
jgi:hypothetical protein